MNKKERSMFEAILHELTFLNGLYATDDRQLRKSTFFKLDTKEMMKDIESLLEVKKDDS